MRAYPQPPQSRRDREDDRSSDTSGTCLGAAPGRDRNANHPLRRPAATLFSLVCGIAVMAALSGCGPVTTASVINDAEHDLAEVRNLDGDKNAPYETTKAASYLHKAKELQGHGLYEQASTYARRSRLLSEKAVEVARLAQERSQRKAKFGGKKGKKSPPSFTPSGGGGR